MIIIFAKLYLKAPIFSAGLSFTNYLLPFTLAWMPALRTGKGWDHYLLFDFKVNARLTRVRINKPTEMFLNPLKPTEPTAVRPIDKVTIEASNNPGSFYEHVIDVAPDQEKMITFATPITARFAKIKITPIISAAADASPIAVNE